MSKQSFLQGARKRSAVEGEGGRGEGERVDAKRKGKANEGENAGRKRTCKRIGVMPQKRKKSEEEREEEKMREFGGGDNEKRRNRDGRDGVESLPPDLLLIILQYCICDSEEYNSIVLVCKGWHFMLRTIYASVPNTFQRRRRRP